MENLVKCTGEGCSLRDECHRFTKIDYYNKQMFFVEIPFDFERENCDFFWNDNAENLYQGIERLLKPTN